MWTNLLHCLFYFYKQNIVIEILRENNGPKLPQPMFRPLSIILPIHNPNSVSVRYFSLFEVISLTMMGFLFVSQKASNSFGYFLSMDETLISLTWHLAFQEPVVDEQSEAAGWSSAKAGSVSWRLQELERQIVASQEEELACRLKLSGLLSIVDDWWRNGRLTLWSFQRLLW